MKSRLCLIAMIAAASLAAPVAAQDARDTGTGIWAPWAVETTVEVAVAEPAAPVVRRAPVRRVQVVASVAPAPQPESLVQRAMKIDRFWVIGSFR